MQKANGVFHKFLPKIFRNIHKKAAVVENSSFFYL